MSFNPYQPPTSAYDSSYTNYGNSGPAVSERTVAALRKTRPWVVFLAVLLFISTGFMVLGGIGIMTQSVGLGLMYIVFSALYGILGAAMIRFSNAINKLLHGGGVNELDQAMEAQASFWQTSGIFALIGMVLIAVGVVAAVALGASTMNTF